MPNKDFGPARFQSFVTKTSPKTVAARLITIYGDQDMVLRKKLERGDWATLILEKA